MLTVDGVAGLRETVGQHIGWSEYEQVTQEQINLFAQATGDHQWIHVDPQRAATQSPFGTTIAHGYLTLSLIPMLSRQVWRVGGVSVGSDAWRIRGRCAWRLARTGWRR